MTRRCGGLDVWTGGLAKRRQLESCFLPLCAEAVFAECDKTWFVWQDKGKPDAPYIFGRIQTVVCAPVFVCQVSTLMPPPPKLFNMLKLNWRKVWWENSTWRLFIQHCPLLAGAGTIRNFYLEQLHKRPHIHTIAVSHFLHIIPKLILGVASNESYSMRSISVPNWCDLWVCLTVEIATAAEDNKY